MKRISLMTAALFLVCASGWAQSAGKGVDRLYVLDCGMGHAPDESRWTMGTNVGKPVDISDSCFLVRHGSEYFLWDTGISDAVAAMPDGWLPTNNPVTDIHWYRKKTLESQLAEIGVKPEQIRSIGISHTHPDHIGMRSFFRKCPSLFRKPNMIFILRRVRKEF
jgi:N-acyl homoserine lactone hydrolase